MLAGSLYTWKKVEGKMRTWTNEDLVATGALPQPHECHTVVWFHDKSTFYAHDRRKARWVHKSETAMPYTKGEGVRSPDGSESVRVLFKAGKA
jgi:hypothetical protein